MSARFFDRQDRTNPANGSSVAGATELRRLLAGLRGRPPFFAELLSENGWTLLLGLGESEGCAQLSRTDGDPPYYMAIDRDPSDADGEMEFLIGDTLSPVPRRYRLPYETLVKVAETFVLTGQRLAELSWEEI